MSIGTLRLHEESRNGNARHKKINTAHAYREKLTLPQARTAAVRIVWRCLKTLLNRRQCGEGKQVNMNNIYVYFVL